MREYVAGFGLRLIERPKKVEASLWRRFHFNQDGYCREKLFKLHQKFARKLAAKEFRRRPPYGLEFSDYEQLAYTGLLEAIDGYDPLRSIPFEAYARYRIIGSISDSSLRSSEDGARYSFKKRVEMDRLNSLGISEFTDEKDALALLSDIAVGLALGFALESTNVSDLEDVPDQNSNAYETLSWREFQFSLFREITKLPKTEKTVVESHYIDGVAFVQIAHLLKVTKGRISQIHKSAISKLRKRIGGFY